VHTTQINKPDLLDLPGSDWLNIGGTERKEGWKILNIQPGEHVDYVSDLRDLSGFADESFDVIYTSHTLEHLGYQKDLATAIAGIYRILRTGGKLYVSVPDLDVLCRLFIHERATMDDRLRIMRMMFGGQLDQYDFHYVGLNGEFLAHYLFKTGFRELYQVPEFNIFKDTSSLRFNNVLISLNMVAIK